MSTPVRRRSYVSSRMNLIRDQFPEPNERNAEIARLLQPTSSGVRVTINPTSYKDPEVQELARQLNKLIKGLPTWAVGGATCDFNQPSTPGVVTIHHKLGHPPTGWIVLRIVALEPTEFTEVPGSADMMSIKFASKLPCSGKVLVF